jgi:hypothetical protein
METASFTGFVKTIFYILMFYYVFKFLAKLLLPLLVKKVVQKAGENFQQQQQYAQNNSWEKTNTKDEIIYTTANTKNPKETKKVGDYVDYEEID